MSLEGMIDRMMTIITANTERTLRLGPGNVQWLYRKSHLI